MLGMEVLEGLEASFWRRGSRATPLRLHRQIPLYPEASYEGQSCPERNWSSMIARINLALSMFLATLLLVAAQAEEFPGGSIQTREALRTDKGSHPKVIVQTVPDATTTATCLVVRFAERNKSLPTRGAAHLWEHLMFRTAPGGKPGALLVRDELNGHQSRAWVTSTELVLAEVVPSSKGLESLSLQLSRLKSVPKDPEGMKLEKRTIASEIRAASDSTEQARRKILEGFGLDPYVEGDRENLSRLNREAISSLLSQLNLEEDVVISIVGPHSARDVRSHLAKNLAPLSLKRKGPREPSLNRAASPSGQTLSNSGGYDQKSLFFEHSVTDPRVLYVARGLLGLTLPDSTTNLETEADSLYRLDVSPADQDLTPLQRDLTPEEVQGLLSTVRRDWLSRYESPLERAELFALSSIRGFKPRTLLSPNELIPLIEQARKMLKHATEKGVPLETRSAKGGITGKLYPFRQRANFGNPSKVEVEKLPNQLKVSIQKMESWPIVAVSGFFRLTPPLSARQSDQLQKSLQSKSGRLTFEVKNDALFFHTWAEPSQLSRLLQETAEELKTLSKIDDLLDGATPVKSGILESFFLAHQKSGTERLLKGSKVFNPRNAHLVVTGELDENALDSGLRPAWSGWFGSDKPPAMYAPNSSEGAKDAPNSKTIAINSTSPPVMVVGFSGPTRSSPNFLAFNLALQTLAGRPTTSLLARHLTDSGIPVLSVKLFPLTGSIQGKEQIWLIAMRLEKAPKKPEELVKKVSELLKGLTQSTFSESDLKRTRSYLKSSLTVAASTVRGRARVLAHAEFHRLSKSYADDFAGLYDHLTPPLVQEVCKTYFQEPKVRSVFFKPRSPSGNSD